MTTSFHEVAAKSGQPSKGLRDHLLEIFAMGALATSVALVWVLIEVKQSITAHNNVVDRSVSLAHANALVTERALARLEEREASKQAKDFRVPPKTDPVERPE